MPDDPASRASRSPTEIQVHRARAGDDEGFASLYERLAPALYTWADLRINRTARSRIDAEEVVQEVWWRAMDGFARFDPAKGTFRAWIFRIATHVLLESFRKARFRTRAEDSGRQARVHSLPPELAAQATSISRAASQADSVRAMAQAVRELETTDRKVFVHCGLEGLSVPKAAELCGISEDACAKRWQRLRTRLRESGLWRELLASD